MNLIALAFAMFYSPVFAAPVLYCGAMGVEGAYLKVEPHTGTICRNGGPFRADYCTGADRKFSIVKDVGGSEVIAGRSYTFRQYTAVAANDEVQTVRVYGAASNPSGADVSVHRADLNGSAITLANTSKPDSEAKDGDPICLAGDDDVF